MVISPKTTNLGKEQAPELKSFRRPKRAKMKGNQMESDLVTKLLIIPPKIYWWPVVSMDFTSLIIIMSKSVILIRMKDILLLLQFVVPSRVEKQQYQCQLQAYALSKVAASAAYTRYVHVPSFTTKLRRAFKSLCCRRRHHL